MTPGWERARAVADAVLYEGYLLYPYRATSGKNQSRWQFGVLGPSGAAERGLGEDDTLGADLLLHAGPDAALHIVVRFLHLQHRAVQRRVGDTFEPVGELRVAESTYLTWDEAVECELSFGPLDVRPGTHTYPLTVAGGSEIEQVEGGRLIRRRADLHAELTVQVEAEDGLRRIWTSVRNLGAPPADARQALATSLLGTHLIALASGGSFVSLLEPPTTAVDAVRRCRRHRCFPVLAGPPGDTSVVLVSPIILYDHPEIAEQSRGDLYDSCEIDEILTLRVMTMTDQEKAQARATDPLAARIIDRCDSMSPEAMLDLHGVLRDPHAVPPSPIPDIPTGTNWWDPEADNAVRPELDAVEVGGTRVARGSRVRLHPSRRADAQDLFYADRTARVTSVHADVDGGTHIGVVLDDDPAADLHDWYGRYLYFAPDEVEPLAGRSSPWK